MCLLPSLLLSSVLVTPAALLSSLFVIVAAVFLLLCSSLFLLASCAFALSLIPGSSPSHFFARLRSASSISRSMFGYDGSARLTVRQRSSASS